MHLDDMEKVHGLSKLSTTFRSELNCRFIPYLEPADRSYEPIYVVSTMLDPRYKLLLNVTQTVSAEYNILNLVKDCIDEKAKSGSSSSGASLPQAQDQQLQQSDEPPSKRFRHLNKLLERKVKEGIKEASKVPAGETELKHYLKNVQT